MRTVIKNGKKFNVNETLYKRMSKLNILKEDNEQHNINILKIINNTYSKLEKIIKKQINSIKFSKTLPKLHGDTNLTDDVRERLSSNLVKTLELIKKAKKDNNVFMKMNRYISTLKNNGYINTNDLEKNIEEEIKKIIWEYVVANFDTNDYESKNEMKQLVFNFDDENNNEDDKKVATNKIEIKNKEELNILRIIKILVFKLLEYDPDYFYLNKNNTWLNYFIDASLLKINFIRKTSGIPNEKNIGLTKKQLEKIKEESPSLKDLDINTYDFYIVDEEDYPNIEDRNKKILNEALKIFLYADGGLKDYFITYEKDLINDMLKYDVEDYAGKNEFLNKKMKTEIIPVVVKNFDKYLTTENLENIKLPYYNEIPTFKFFRYYDEAKSWWDKMNISHAWGRI